MIHELLTLTRPLFVFDTETTGTDAHNDRIVEFGFQMWIGEGSCKNCENYETAFKSGVITEIPPCDYCKGSRRVGGLAKEWRSLINPGIPIPPSATKIHGITDAMVQGCRDCLQPRQIHPTADCPAFKPWPYFKQIAQNIAKGLAQCDFAGKHVRFDLQITAAEMQRSDIEWSYHEARIIDIDRLEALAEPRSLSHLYKKYTGEDHEGAHGALSDVRASTIVIVQQLQRHTQLPRDLNALHSAQWIDWLDVEGKFRMIDGVAVCNFGKKYKGKPMRDIPLDFYDWILKEKFPPDVKLLARNAKLGIFPEKS